jgi:hypothetical protein
MDDENFLYSFTSSLMYPEMKKEIVLIAILEIKTAATTNGATKDPKTRVQMTTVRSVRLLVLVECPQHRVSSRFAYLVSALYFYSESAYQPH